MPIDPNLFQYYVFLRFEYIFLTHSTDCQYLHNERFMINHNQFQIFSIHYLILVIFLSIEKNKKDDVIRME